MKTELTLRGLVFSKYKNINEFANAIGWNRNKASRILSEAQELNAQDIQEITQCLEINSIQLFMQIFFNSLSTMYTFDQNGAALPPLK